MGSREVGTTYHCSVSVDIDRFTDAMLRKRWCRGLLINGDHPTPSDIRVLCAAARAKGHKAL